MIWEQIVNNMLTAPVLKDLPSQTTHKTCRDCGSTKPRNMFYERQGGASNTLRCKACYIAHQKELKARAVIRKQLKAQHA